MVGACHFVVELRTCAHVSVKRLCVSAVTQFAYTVSVLLKKFFFVQTNKSMSGFRRCFVISRKCLRIKRSLHKKKY